MPKAPPFLRPAIIWINPHHHSLEYAWLKRAATKLEDNLPGSQGVGKTGSITQSICARSGCFQMKRELLQAIPTQSSRGLVFVAVNRAGVLFECKDITAHPCG